MKNRSAEFVLLYDGLCGFCDGVVQFMLSHDRGGSMRFAPLQGEFARGVIARHPELRGLDSLVLVRADASGETVRTRSSAVVEICRYLGGTWSVGGAALWIVPWFVRDVAYDLFARVRYRVWGRRDACRLPTPAERARFID